MTLEFTKMHGLGNDFVVIDGTRRSVVLDDADIVAIADRRLGIGCDQVLLVEPAHLPGTEFHYRIFNADGGEVEQCGNGARCFARFVHDRGLTASTEITVGTAAGPITLFLEQDDTVRVDMGIPRLAPAEIPFEADRESVRYPLSVGSETLEIGALSMGNPHAVVLVDDVWAAPVSRLGPQIESHPRFPQRANAGFMAVVDRRTIDLRVFERGSGETLACGTGACAAVVYGRRLGLLDEQVEVHLPGGTLVISWRGVGSPVWMRGPATFVYDGVVDIDRLATERRRHKPAVQTGGLHEPAAG